MAVNFITVAPVQITEKVEPTDEDWKSHANTGALQADPRRAPPTSLPQHSPIHPRIMRVILV